MKKIRIQEVKQALRDPEFRKKLPPEFKDDLQKYEQNPGCLCNLPIYMKVLKAASKELMEYFPGMTVEKEEEIVKLAKNNFTVMNCHVDELEDKLKKLPPGRKQIALSRYQDQITVVINELDLVF